MFHTITIPMSKEEREVSQLLADIFNKEEIGNHIPLVSAAELGHFEFKIRDRKIWQKNICGASDKLGGRKRARIAYALGERVGNVSLVQKTDLRDVSDHTDRCVTTVYITDGDDHYDRPSTKWLVFGSATVRLDITPNRLCGYLKGNVTDFEHDAAFVLRLPLIGVRLDMLHGHTTHLEGWVATHAEDEFHVPWPGYDPVKHPDTVTCDYGHCKDDPHPMVPEGYYVPPTDKDLYEYVAGRRVSIRIGPVWEDGDE